MLHIFPTSRMVREFYSRFGENSLLPQAISIANFESKILLVPDLVLASEDRRVLIMQSSCQFENFKKLNIPDEFLAFLSNSSYLFRFFEELAVEQKSCSDLKNVDVYDEFYEHLSILDELHKRYSKLLEQEGFYDSITLPNLYEINWDYLNRFDTILVHVEGFLNSFEWNIFKQISKNLNVEFSLDINEYNQKMRQLFLDEDIKLPYNGKFKITLNNKSFKVLNEDRKNPQIVVKNFSIRSLQIGYIKEQISNFIKSGIAPEEIVVVLPDESLAPLLKAYDKTHNLNFAMGFSFTETKIFQILNSLHEAIQEDTPLTQNLLLRYSLSEKIASFKNIWTKEICFDEFEKLINSLEFEFSTQTKAIFQNELYHIGIILKHINLKLSQIYKLFLQRLSKVSLDDIKGGRVVVMGVLETRGANFKGVIIPDFNDEFVPRFSQKDMFLSSSLRSYAKLPSLKDRENLQRYYYYQIIQNAQKVAICYTENDNFMVSRFLQSLNYQNDTRFSENSYSTLLFEKKEQQKVYLHQDLIEENSIFKKPISSSRLKLFLTCKRGYYFKYILKLKDEDLPSDDLNLNDIGNFLHESLLEAYQDKSCFKSLKSLHDTICNKLDQKYHKKSLWLLEREVWKKRLFGFCENELKRFDEGWMPIAFEKRLECKFNGVDIYGFIDRIDRGKNGEICVLDYKSGRVHVEKKIENMSDFQLQFYYLLALNEFGSVTNTGFYDLVNSRIVYDEDMDRKLEKLAMIFDEIKSQKVINFTKDIKDCLYSPYSILLGEE